MVTNQAITKKVLSEVVSRTGFNEKLIAKDYYVTLLLSLLKDVNGLYFKGGTALNKIFLEYSRLSEDIDFTVTRDILMVKKEIEEIVKKHKAFSKIEKDKHVSHFIRLIAHYESPFGGEGTVHIDLNKKAKLKLPSEHHGIKHFYPEYISEFSVKTLAKKEMVAEKMAATIGRNKPRDHFDLYQIIKRNIPIDLTLVRQKCEDSEHEFDIIKMFNKAKKLKNRWDEDMVPLLVTEISFQTVMKTLAQHFNLKKEKEIQKDEEKTF